MIIGYRLQKIPIVLKSHRQIEWRQRIDKIIYKGIFIASLLLIIGLYFEFFTSGFTAGELDKGEFVKKAGIFYTNCQNFDL